MSRSKRNPHSDVSEIISATAAEEAKDGSQIWTGDMGLQLETGLLPELAGLGRVARERESYQLQLGGWGGEEEGGREREREREGERENYQLQLGGWGGERGRGGGRDG